jgi:hypothetical protein
MILSQAQNIVKSIELDSAKLLSKDSGGGGAQSTPSRSRSRPDLGKSSAIAIPLNITSLRVKAADGILAPRS